MENCLSKEMCEMCAEYERCFREMREKLDLSEKRRKHEIEIVEKFYIERLKMMF